MSSNKVLPNTFQHPNLYVDRLAFYLTPEEEKVLNKAVREILGWQDKLETRTASISLSVFVDGKFDDNGRQLTMGCGLSIGTVRSALKVLVRFGVLTKVGEPTKFGQSYSLQIDENEIDWEGLEERRARRDRKNEKRTRRARESNPFNQDEDTPTVGQDEYCETEGVLSDNTEGVLSDSRERGTVGQQQRNPEKPKRNPNTGAAAPLKRVRDGPKTQLMNLFLTETGIVMPNRKRDVGFWWSSIAEIYNIAGEDIERGVDLMRRTIGHMREKDLMIASPNSLLNPMRSIAAQNGSDYVIENGKRYRVIK